MSLTDKLQRDDELRQAFAEREERLARLADELDERRREAEDHARRARELAAALETRGLEIEQLNRNERELVHALEVRGREVEELNGQVRALSEGLDLRGQEVETLNEDVMALSRALQARGREIEALNEKARELEGALARRGEEVETLHDVLRSRSGEMSRLERELLSRAGDSPTPARAPAPPVPTPPAPAARAALPTSSGSRRGATAGALGLHRRRANIAALAWTLARTDVKIRYHGTWAGFLWALLKPVAILGVLMTVFSLMFTATPDYKLRLVLGLILWDYFAEGTRVGLLSLLAKGALLTKMSLPRWIVVLTSQASALLTLSVFVCGFLVFLAAIGRFPRPAALLGFLICLALLVVGVLGLALAMSVLFLRYRDLNQIWEVVSQAGFFLAPIVYPMDLIPERYRPLLFLWLPTPIVEFSRRALLDGRLPAMEAIGLLALACVLLLVLGVAIFRSQIARAAERL